MVKTCQDHIVNKSHMKVRSRDFTIIHLFIIYKYIYIINYIYIYYVYCILSSVHFIANKNLPLLAIIHILSHPTVATIGKKELVAEMGCHFSHIHGIRVISSYFMFLSFSSSSFVQVALLSWSCQGRMAGWIANVYTDWAIHVQISVFIKCNRHFSEQNTKIKNVEYEILYVM